MKEYIYFAVDENGEEWAYRHKPKRNKTHWHDDFINQMPLPKGSIKAITGKEITWEDEPIKWKP